MTLFLLLQLAACVSPQPRLQAGEIGTIAGKETAGLSEEGARDKVLAEAARLTVDHGYRYFVLLPAANPAAARPAPVVSVHAGQAQRFQIVRNAPSRRPRTNVWDAYRLLTRKPETH